MVLLNLKFGGTKRPEDLQRIIKWSVVPLVIWYLDIYKLVIVLLNKSVII